MRLYNYLNEGRSKQLDKGRVESMLEGYCGDALDQYIDGFVMGRGSGTRGPYLHTKPTGDRKSRFAQHNYYTLIMNNHPMWSKYPKREIICADDKQRAEEHYAGYVYNVFPFDGAKIGVCPENDIGDSFPMIEEYKIADNMDDFNGGLNYVLDEFGHDGDDGNSLKEAFDDITLGDCMRKFGKVSTLIDEETFELWGESKKDEESTLGELIEEVMHPQNNGFRVVPISKFNTNDNLEVGTDVDCIMVNSEMTEELMMDLGVI